MLPTSVTQVLLTLLFVVPGFVYQTVRISVRGRLPYDVDLSARIVRAIVASVIFGLVYLCVLGQALVETAHGRGYLFDHPRAGAAVGLVGGIVLPSAAAVLLRVPQWPILERWSWLQWLKARLPEMTRYDPVPTAWDKTFQSRSECFVRILNAEGRWVAGYFGANSYATSFPEPQQLFLETAYLTDKKGVIGAPIEASAGILIDCTGIQLLQILAADDQSGLGEEAS